MDVRAEKTFYRRLYILIFLTGAIICALFYLLLHPVSNHSNTNNVISIQKVIHKADIDHSIVMFSKTLPEEEQVITYTAEQFIEDTSLLRIVSPTMKLDSSYIPNDLQTPSVLMYQTQQLSNSASIALEELFEAALQDGFQLYLISGYRSYQYQNDLYQYYVGYYGKAYADMMDATPGGSEHQLGLSVDLGTADQVCRLDTCFQDTDAYQWLQEHSYQYGYIERYPANKTTDTGIMYSPWSFRYVGQEAALFMHDENITLEEMYQQVQ